MTRRYGLIVHRGHWCIEAPDRSIDPDTCVSTKYAANKVSIQRYLRRLNEEVERGHGLDARGERDRLAGRVDAGAR
jgi:hypothetical protein